MSSIRDFIPLQKIGQGTFSTVYKVRRVSDQKIYAIKKVRLNNLSQKQKQNALNQIRILASFQCQYIVAYKQAFFDQKLNVLCIVMEFADGGDLHKIIDKAKKDYRSIAQKDIWRFISHILTGLKHLHDKGILHRDLKSANIFIFGQKYKLGDLNVSKVNGGKLAYTQTGTPYYASPQVWRDQPYDSKSDIWSFGCIIYEMACLRPPFNGKDMQQLYKSVQNKKYTPIPQKYSPQLFDFIQRCLQKNPHNRSSAAQLLQNININRYQNNYENDANQELLKTIKLPNDLKSLQNKLPESKYQKRKSVDFDSPKNFISDRQYIVNNFSMRPASIKSPKNLNVMNSQIFLSPRNVNKNSIQFLSPAQNGSKRINSAHLNLSQKKIQPSKYSQRIQALQNRKICSSHNHRSQLIDKYDKYIKEQINKHSIVMPRTQKRKIQSQNGPDRRAIQEWKKKLVKKSRIFSNNNQKNFLIN